MSKKKVKVLIDQDKDINIFADEEVEVNLTYLDETFDLDEILREISKENLVKII